jgi:hypothetical protein
MREALRGLTVPLVQVVKTDHEWHKAEAGIVGDSASRQVIAPVPEQESPQDRWPRRWRYVFVFGTALLFWIAVGLLLRAV